MLIERSSIIFLKQESKLYLSVTLRRVEHAKFLAPLAIWLTKCLHEGYD